MCWKSEQRALFVQFDKNYLGKSGTFLKKFYMQGKVYK